MKFTSSITERNKNSRKGGSALVDGIRELQVLLVLLLINVVLVIICQPFGSS